MNITYIYGKHAVEEALRKRLDVVKTVYAADGALDDPKLAALARKTGEVQTIDERKLPGGLHKEATHQGIIAAIDTSKLLIPWKKFKASLEATPDTALVILGEVQDPHNVGAIIRSAAAFAAGAVLIPEHRQAPLTGTVIKVSAGAAFSVPLVSIGNVNAALRELKDKGFWTYGLDMEGDSSLTEERFDRASAFVVGNEGKGMREKTREHCDTILTIPMHPRAESLNASVSAAVCLYAWSSHHPVAVKRE